MLTHQTSNRGPRFSPKPRACVRYGGMKHSFVAKREKCGSVNRLAIAEDQRMTGFGKFLDAMIDAARAHLDTFLHEDGAALAEAVKNHIFDLDGPRTGRRNLTHKDELFGKTFRQFLEIGSLSRHLTTLHFT